jgi:hypothetical protein
MANLDGRIFPLMGMREERPRAFGGVRRDVGWLSSVPVPVNLLFAVDLPVSLVADVVTLPQVKNEQVRWDAEQDDAHVVNPPAQTPEGSSDLN